VQPVETAPAGVFAGAVDNAAVSVDHYENFPVASLLCPAPLRPAVVAIYHFARTADDLADEGDAPAEQRLQALAQYRSDLQAALGGAAGSGRWAAVFGPLQVEAQRHELPARWLHALLDYCARSANPIGRLLLHLYRVGDAASLRQSDAICSALQLINFWQDLSVDLPRGRVYVPLDALPRHGLAIEQLRQPVDGPAWHALVRELVDWSVALMDEGAPLALRMPGRLGWELRLVVQGGLRILEKIRAMDYSTVRQRPVLGRRDAPLLLWRAGRMAA
jgi:hydroxysqualene synthase